MPKYDVLRDAKKYIEAFLCIKTKESEIVPFRLNSAQNRLYECIKEQQAEGKPIRIIILKSRQMGFSTLTEALIYYKTATRSNVNSFIITHKDDATTNLFNMSKLFQERNPARPLLKNSNAKELIFEKQDKMRNGRGQGCWAKRHLNECACFGAGVLARRDWGDLFRTDAGGACDKGQHGYHRKHGERIQLFQKHVG